MELEDRTYSYFAFISYKREDERWAKWLQRKLESYSLPSVLRKDNPGLPERIRPVFRDRSELSGGNLKAEIEKGLDESKYLIVICSPRSAKSPWVSKEVQYFIDRGLDDRIIPFIIGGTPNATDPGDECFPEGLRQLTGEKEILGININDMGRDAAVIKVIARMFDIRFDSLWQRFEKEKRRRRVFVGIAGAVTVAVSLMVAGYIAAQNSRLQKANAAIIAQRERAENALAELKIANDSIIRSKSIISLYNDSLKETNSRLVLSNRNLFAEREKVVDANRKLKIQLADMNATYILNGVSDGRLPLVRSVAGHLFDPEVAKDELLPITPLAEKALRDLYSIKDVDGIVRVNNEDVSFDRLIESSGDTVTVANKGRIMYYDMIAGEIVGEIAPDIDFSRSALNFIGRLNETSFGIVVGDSIYAVNIDPGSVVNRSRWLHPAYFRQLNDSVIIAPGIFGFYERVDSRTFNAIGSTSIKCNPLFAKQFAIDSDEGVLYQVEASNTAVGRDLETGEIVWSKKFDYDIRDLIIKFDGLKLVGVMTGRGDIELWPTDGSDILETIRQPGEGIEEFMSGESLSFMTLASSDYNNYDFSRWKFHAELPYSASYVDKDLNRYRVYDESLDFKSKDSDEWLSIAGLNEGDWFALISTGETGLLARIKFEDEPRIVFFRFGPDKELESALLLSGAGQDEKHDWMDGFEHYLYSNAVNRPLAFQIPFAEFGQLSDINTSSTLAAIALWRKTLLVNELKDDGQRYSKRLDSDIFTVNYIPGRDELLVATEAGLFLYDRDLTGCKKLTLKDCDRPIMSKVSDRRNLMAVSDFDNRLHIYKYPSLVPVKSTPVYALVRDMDFNSDGSLIAVVTPANEVKVFKTDGLEMVFQFQLGFEVAGVEFSSDGKTIVANGQGKSFLIPFPDLRVIMDGI